MAIKRLEEDLDAGTPPTKSRCTQDNRILAPAQADDKTVADELNSEAFPAKEKPADPLIVKSQMLEVNLSMATKRTTTASPTTSTLTQKQMEEQAEADELNETYGGGFTKRARHSVVEANMNAGSEASTPPLVQTKAATEQSISDYVLSLGLRVCGRKFGELTATRGRDFAKVAFARALKDRKAERAKANASDDDVAFERGGDDAPVQADELSNSAKREVGPAFQSAAEELAEIERAKARETDADKTNSELSENQLDIFEHFFNKDRSSYYGHHVEELIANRNENDYARMLFQSDFEIVTDSLNRECFRLEV